MLCSGCPSECKMMMIDQPADHRGLHGARSQRYKSYYDHMPSGAHRRTDQEHSVHERPHGRDLKRAFASEDR